MSPSTPAPTGPSPPPTPPPPQQQLHQQQLQQQQPSKQLLQQQKQQQQQQQQQAATTAARPVIPSTFFTLSDQSPSSSSLPQDELDDDEDQDDSDSDLAPINTSSNTSQPSSSSSTRKRTVTAGNNSSTVNNNPYLSSASAPGGVRSLSTPNLHANEVSAALMASPMPSPTQSPSQSPSNSPPTSPGLPPLTQSLSTNRPTSTSSVSSSASAPSSIAIDNMAPLSLPSSHNNKNGDTPQRHHSDNSTGTPDRLVLTLSPIASPQSSPRLTPRQQPSSALPPLNGRSSLGAAATTIPSSQSTRSSKATPPLAPGSGADSKTDSHKTLKSSKNKTINRNSVVSLFDTTSSSMTLPTNFARKGSLPQDAVNGTQGQGLAGLFANGQQAQDLTATPFSLTLAEFRLNDIYPKRQRRLLTVLHRMDNRLRKEGVIRKLSKEQLKGKPDKEILKPDRKSLNKEYAKKGGQGGFMAQRIPAFLRSKKLKKRTRPGKKKLYV
ncbi:hypothetical protein BGZ83_009871 [Gryganskiella cystojenkinii]|nr:hypothetical protein BGZ83_009871 [Gryganskiella cystojenkinii]